MKQEKDKRMSEEVFICEYCGIKYRYSSNLRVHLKKCLDKQFAK